MIASCLILGIIFFNAKQDGPLKRKVIIEIPNSLSLLKISDLLFQSNILGSRYNFILLNYFTREYKNLKAGEYLFLPNISEREISIKLVKNEVILHRLTIPECYSNKKIIYKIEKTKELEGEIAKNYVEGDFFPDTYFYPKGTPKVQILELMRNMAKRKINNAYKKVGVFPEGINNIGEVLILASLIEAEAKKGSEKKRIASVFLNRLKKGMKLQSDPTVVYGLVGSVYLGRKLTKQDLNVEHIWNTYKINGLPPTPICNVGIDSIESVFSPMETNDLYFVADGKGGHHFSQTLEQHNRYVKNLKN